MTNARRIHAVEDLSFNFNRQIFGFLGPNGAGKRRLSGYRRHYLPNKENRAFRENSRNPDRIVICRIKRAYKKITVQNSFAISALRACRIEPTNSLISARPRSFRWKKKKTTIFQRNGRQRSSYRDRFARSDLFYSDETFRDSIPKREVPDRSHRRA